MYRDLINVAKEVILIADEKAREVTKTNKGTISAGEGIFDVIFNPNPYRQRFLNVLEDLEIEQILALQTIMYLGRDKEYDPNLSPAEIFQSNYDSLVSLGVNKKSIEINQMIEKVPLGDYLREGYHILGIDI